MRVLAGRQLTGRGCGAAGVWDSRIASSRDGTSFKYIGGDRSPWLQRGRWGGLPPAKCNRINSADHSDDGKIVLSRSVVLSISLTLKAPPNSSVVRAAWQRLGFEHGRRSAWILHRG